MLLAEFDSADELVRAVKQLRALGHEDVESYAPHAIEELEALEPRPRLPWVAGLAGFAAAGGAYFLQWYLACVDYPLDVGGRPQHAPLAFVPISFELGVLAAALVTVVGLIRGCGLPRLWRPIFEAEGFERASVDAFFVSARDDAKRALWAVGAKRVVAYGLAAFALVGASGCDLQRMSDQHRPEPAPAPRASVARGSLPSEDSPAVTRALLERGRDRFAIFCAPCHGVLGDADTAIADRMALRRPRSLLDDGMRRKPAAELYLVVKKGFGLMPGYEAQLPPKDRWAVAHYVKALQLSQGVALDDLPAAVRSEALDRIQGDRGELRGAREGRP